MNNKTRKCGLTKYAVEDDASYGEGRKIQWRLRYASLKNDRTALVQKDGTISGERWPQEYSCFVRPALWVSLEKMTDNRKD